MSPKIVRRRFVGRSICVMWRPTNSCPAGVCGWSLIWTMRSLREPGGTLHAEQPFTPSEATVERTRIICPETGRFEDIDCERAPLGVVVAGCSRFEPRSAVECTRRCAAQMDRSDRRDVDDRAERILVVRADADHETRPFAEALARCLVRDGFTVELADPTPRTAPPPADYDAVVVGASARSGKHQRSVIEYIVSHRIALGEMPAFYFSVSPESRTRRPHDPQRDTGRITRETGWLPTSTAAFAEAVPHTTVDASSGHVVGEPDDVRGFAARIADEVTALQLIPTMQ